MTRPLTIVHTSDVHVEQGYMARAHGGDGAAPLAIVLDAARDCGADVVLLCGDTFDCHKIPRALAARVGALIAAADVPVVLLPGNHDPAMEDAIWHVGELTRLPNLHILGVPDEAVLFPALDLEVWGRPHRDWGDMVPLATPRPRGARWQIAMAHGHYDPKQDRSKWPRPSWLIDDAEIRATGADYLALGHWNRAIAVGDGIVPAFYSGSPDYARSVNVVRLSAEQGVRVERMPLAWPGAAA